MSDTYDPGEYTVDEVKDYVTDHPDETEAVRSAEQAGKARVTLLDWLDTQLTAATDEETAPEEQASDSSLPENEVPQQPEPLPAEGAPPPDDASNPTLGEQDIRQAGPTEEPPIPSQVVKATEYRTP